jgi:hypothetical protein
MKAALCIALIALLGSCTPKAQSPADRAGSWAWPSVSAKSGVAADGAHDAAVVIGIENYLFVPKIPGAAASASDWYRFLVEDRKVPVERVRLLVDGDAVREKIAAAVDSAAAAADPDGTVWLVFIGHGAPLASGDKTEGVLVGADVQQDAQSLAARSITRAELAPASVTWLSAAGAGQFAGPLPGAERPAFSYLMLGALRAWAAAPDGTVTAKDAVGYARKAMAVLEPKMGHVAHDSSGQGHDGKLVNGPQWGRGRVTARSNTSSSRTTSRSTATGRSRSRRGRSPHPWKRASTTNRTRCIGRFLMRKATGPTRRRSRIVSGCPATDRASAIPRAISTSATFIASAPAGTA